MDFTNFFSSESKCTVWINEKFTLTKKLFRQINYLVVYLVNPLLSRNFYQNCLWREFPKFPHCAHCGKMKNLLSPNFFPSNQLFSDLFSKCIAFTKFLPKNVRVNFCNFHTVLWNDRFFNKNFRENNVYILKLLNSWFDEIFFRG